MKHVIWTHFNPSGQLARTFRSGAACASRASSRRAVPAGWPCDTLDSIWPAGRPASAAGTTVDEFALDYNYYSFWARQMIDCRRLRRLREGELIYLGPSGRARRRPVRLQIVGSARWRQIQTVPSVGGTRAPSSRRRSAGGERPRTARPGESAIDAEQQ